MKSTTTDLRTHLDKEVTALSTCWRVERRDGKVLLFTDCDEDITIDGETYSSIGAYSRTAIESTSTLSVDNLDITGLTSEISLPTAELRSGLFDHAQVKIFLTPWMQRYPGKLKLRRGFFGEVQVLPNNTFKVELRGLMQRFSNSFTEIYSSTCRNDFGDRSCGVAVEGPVAVSGQAYGLGDVVRIPQAGQLHGKRYDLKIGDKDFSDLGSNGMEDAQYWIDTGASTLPLADNTVSKVGAYSGRATGAGVLTQDVALVDDVTTTTKDIDLGHCYLTLRAWRKDGVDAAQMRLQFLDWKRRRVRLGVVADLSNATTGVTITPLSLQDFTVETWINLVKSSTNRGIAGRNAGGAGYYQGFQFGTGNTPQFTFQPAPSNTGYYLYITSEKSLTLGEWAHVAVTRSGDVTQILVNGEVTATYTGWTDLFKIDRLFADHNNEAAYAKYDDYRVWNVAKTPGEIRERMEEDQPAGIPGLLYYFPFENGGENVGSVAGTISILTAADRSTPVVNTIRGNYNDWGTGYESVGGTWVFRGPDKFQLPAKARYVRILFDGTSTASRIDYPHGWIINTAQPDPSPESFGNKIYKCTTAGVYPTGTQFAESNSYSRAATVRESEGTRIFTIDVDESRAVDGWFDGGLVTMHSGRNKGASMEVKSWQRAANRVELFLSLPYPIEPGDTLTIYPGCDKSRVCCAVLFNNVKNFFGTPDVPGEDALFRYPDSNA